MKYYESIKNLNKKEFISKMDLLNNEDLCKALLGLCKVEDYDWVQEQYFKYLYHDNIWVKKAALSGFSELARIHKTLNKKRVEKELNILAYKNKELEGKIMDVLSDIEIFVKTK